jgi:D-alanyl-D-alanine carboxypeptidase (penicillin-binding protein 5/6)
MKRAILLISAAATLALPASAATPQFDTPAPIAYLVDVNSGAVLYSKNADVPFPPASLAKMMETELAFQLIDSGQLQLNHMCTVSPATWQQWHGPAAGSTMFLSPNEQVSVENLLHGIITLSGNDAAIVLAECVGGNVQTYVQQENELAHKLGLTGSYFGTPNGWPDNDVTHVTARDLAKLALATITQHPKLYKQFYSQPNFSWGKTMQGAAITQENRNPILGHVPGADGLKTGHTDEAGYGFVGSADQNGRRLIEVLAKMSSWDQRVQESTKLMQWGFGAWQDKPLFKTGQKVADADVQMGSSSTVPLVAPRDLAVTVPAGLLSGKFQVKVRYNGPIAAPIAKGQHVADLVVLTGDTQPQTVPLVAGEDVGKAGFFTRAWTALKNIL